MAELNGILNTTSIVEDLGVERLILESDSLTAVKLVNLRVHKHHPHAVLVNQIRAKLTNHTDSYVVRHVFREANYVTNYLSKLLDSPLLIAPRLLPMIIEEFIFLTL